MDKTNMAKLSRIDELSARKLYVETMLSEAKKQLKDDIMLLLSGAFTDNARENVEGMTIFLERWIKDIDEEIECL